MYFLITGGDDGSEELCVESLSSLEDSSVSDMLRFKESSVSSLFDLFSLLPYIVFGMPAVFFFWGVENNVLIEPKECEALNKLCFAFECGIVSGSLKDFLNSYKINN